MCFLPYGRLLGFGGVRVRVACYCLLLQGDRAYSIQRTVPVYTFRHTGDQHQNSQFSVLMLGQSSVQESAAVT